ncbi:MAG: VOC family protein [Parasphingorhabdus sp.]|uniref:VOC family protein n=1 Tax=Parasphingorhabdus sp. TaxID=2709688 RepID=UPI003297C8BD
MYRALLYPLLTLLGGCSFLVFGEASERADDPVIKGINYISITVNNLDEATNIFADVADLQVVDERKMTQIPGSESLLGRKKFTAQTRMMRSHNAQLRFVQFEDAHQSRKTYPKVDVYGPGVAHVAFQVNEETSAYSKFLTAGAKPVNGTPNMITLNPDNPVEYAYARDANQTMYEFEHVDFSKLDRDTPPKYDYRIRHVALATPDFDRIVKFYSILLEQKQPRRLGRLINLQGENFDNVSGLADTKLKMAFFNVRNMELEIAQYVSHPTKLPKKPRPLDAPGFAMIVFDVEDLDAARAILITAGGSIVSEAERMDNGQMMVARDPDGNLLGFQKLDPKSIFSSQNFDGDGTS